ncbi:MAG TPA: hypothetical protein VF283_22015 [Bryobacteraceae bacterium]
MATESKGAPQASPGTAVGKRELPKRMLLALSIANLCFLFIWGEILRVASDKSIGYFLQKPPDREFLWALLFDVVVLGVVVFCLLSLRNNRVRPLKGFSIGILVLICLFGLYQIWHGIERLLAHILTAKFAWIVPVVIICIVGFFAIRNRKRTLSMLRAFFLVLSPLFFVLTADSLWLYYRTPAAPFTAGHAAGLLPAVRSPNRVIWIIFDELDYKYAFDAFEAKPARIQLPNFHALRATSIFGTHVQSPAGDTMWAMPSLVLAKTVPEDGGMDTAVRPVRVRISGCSHSVPLKSQPNVFRRARALGFNTAVSGWFHPYCRLFGGDLSACATTTGSADWISIFQQLLRDRPFFEKAAYLAGWQSRILPMVRRFRLFGQMPDEYADTRQVLIRKLTSELKNGFAMLKNPRLNFVLLHIPCPHPPGVWDVQKHAYTTQGGHDYIDNLVNADRIMGKIRRILVQTGDWDRSTILVSADHPYRPDLWLTLNDLPPSPEMVSLTHMKRQPYIPFILKMPGEQSGIVYPRAFNSVLSANLLLAALQGQIRTPTQAVQWLDTHAVTSEEKGCR